MIDIIPRSRSAGSAIRQIPLVIAHRAAARTRAADVAGKLRGLKLAKAARVVTEGIADTLTYYAFPSEHWRSLRPTIPLNG